MGAGQKKQHVGQHIRKIRELQGISQQFVADEAEMSQGSYSRFENGSDILFGKLQQVCNVLGISLKDILEDDGNNVSVNMTQTNNETAIGVAINRMSKNEQRAYDEHIQSLRDEISFLKETLNKIIATKKKEK